MTPVKFFEHLHESCLEKGALEYAHKFFCQPECADKRCPIALQILKKKFPYIHFIEPSNGYILADIQPLMNQINFELSKKERVLFIIKAVDQMGQAVANRLLKTLEEPPHGYHFLLLTANITHVLETIKSRGIMMNFLNSWCTPPPPHKLVHLFTQPSLPTLAKFEQILDGDEPEEAISQELINQIAEHFEKIYIEHGSYKNKTAYQELKKLSQNPFHFSGKTKNLWRQCYLILTKIIQ